MKDIKQLIKEFNLDYLSEYRLRKDRIRNLSAEDWLEKEIKELLEAHEASIKAEIKKMKKYTPKNTNEVKSGEMKYMFAYGYNEAIKDLLKLLK